MLGAGVDTGEAEYGADEGESEGDYDPYAPLPAKHSWPEVLGMSVKKALPFVAASPSVTMVIPVPEGDAVIDDWVPTRVWLWYYPENMTVSRVPQLG